MEVLKKSSEFLVHPVDSLNKTSGVVVIHSRATKPKCHTCQGKKCVHVNIYLDFAKSSKEGEEFPTKKIQTKEKDENLELDPTSKNGKQSNVFAIKIYYPPTKEDKVQINKINEVQTLFPDKVLVPKIEPGDSCGCGFVWLEPTLGDCEGTNIHIHHSKITSDSRSSSLILLYRKTGLCNCKLPYSGEQDKLLRVSGFNPNVNRSADPIHFVSYDLLFEYHASTHAGGSTQNGFLQSKNEINKIVRGQEMEIPKHVFRKAYEIFIHAIEYNIELAWNCRLCPEPLDTKAGEREDQFDQFECHISDGINMGTIENDIKGVTERDIFEEEVIDNKIVFGIEANGRTLVKNQKERKILETLLSANIKNVRVKLDGLKQKGIVKTIANLLRRLEKVETKLPESYNLLIQELSKCTPISVLLPSNEDLDFKLLEAFLDKSVDIFSDYPATKKVTEAFPVIIRIMKQILKYEDDTFLPNDVTEIFRAMLVLKSEYNSLARDRAVPRKCPSAPSPPAQVYPYNPVHSAKHTYDADANTDKTDDKNECNKIYNESSTITGGITHLTCNHSIVKGFTAMKRGESVGNIVHPIVSRLPQRVRAKRRFLLYDNACQARKYAERRFPHRVRHWSFLVDRKHWENHTACSQAYCMDEYPMLKRVNSQVSEQTNRSLRKLSVILAYFGWENYLKVLELFFVARNLKIKGEMI